MGGGSSTVAVVSENVEDDQSKVTNLLENSVAQEPSQETNNLQNPVEQEQSQVTNNLKSIVKQKLSEVTIFLESAVDQEQTEVKSTVEEEQSQLIAASKNTLVPEIMRNELLEFYCQLNKHNIKFSDIFSALFTLQKEVTSLERKLESSIAQQKNKDKELEEFKNNVKSIMSRVQINEEESEEWKSSVNKNTLEIDLIKKQYEKEIEDLKNTINREDKQMQKEDTNKKEFYLLKPIVDNPDKSNKLDYKQDPEFKDTVLHKKLDKHVEENQKIIVHLKQEVTNCETSIFQQNEEMKKMIDIVKENDSNCNKINQTIQELKTDQKNAEEILSIKLKEIQDIEFDLHIKFGNVEDKLRTSQKIINDINKMLTKHHEQIDENKLIIHNQEEFIKSEISILGGQLDVLYQSKKETILHEACKRNQITKIAKLLQNEIDINAIDENGNTPLHIAISRNHLKAVKLLLKYRAKLNAINRWGFTPIMCDTSFPILECIPQYDAGPNISSSLGLTDLHIAILTGNIKMVETYLIFDVNVKGIHELIALHMLGNICGEENIINLLFKYCVDISDNINFEKIILFLFYNITSMTRHKEFKDFCVILLKKLLSYSNFKKRVGQSKFIFVLMKHLDYCSNFQLSYSVIKYIWEIMVTLTITDPDNCISVMNYGCVDYFITCYNSLSQDTTCLLNMIVTMNNISEVENLREKMLDSTFLLILLEVIDLENVCKHYIIKLFGHLLSDNPDTWIVNNPSRDTILQKVENVIDNTSPAATHDMQCNSLKSIFHLLTNDTTYQVQLCGAWLLANVMHSYPKIYVSQFIELDGLNTLQLINNKATTNNKVKELINTTIKFFFIK